MTERSREGLFTRGSRRSKEAVARATVARQFADAERRADGSDLDLDGFAGFEMDDEWLVIYDTNNPDAWVVSSDRRSVVR